MTLIQIEKKNNKDLTVQTGRVGYLFPILLFSTLCFLSWLIYLTAVGFYQRRPYTSSKGIGNADADVGGRYDKGPV